MNLPPTVDHPASIRQHSRFMSRIAPCTPDALTGLPDHHFLAQRLYLALSRTEGTEHGALLLFDLDDFRLVNVACGRDTGDRILQAVGEYLVAQADRAATVARVGSNEFAVLIPQLPGGSTNAAARALAEGLRASLSATPFIVDCESYIVSASAGVAILTPGQTQPEGAMREAEVAMHHARQHGGSQTVLFKSGQQEALRERFDITQHLARALDTHQLQMYIQPQFEQGGQVYGAELLARWRHPSRGDISPAIFIPIAEEAGLITRLTHWSLEVACRTARDLQRLGMRHPLSVNISAKLLADQHFASLVARRLAESGIPGQRLVFEITERVLLEDSAEIMRCIHELSDLGIRFSVDDFGTGYSNLALLNRLPLYELKIDQSLVRSIPHDKDDLAIIQMILTMADQLGLQVVAEGVETRAQADFLSARACKALQGYLMARPMPIEQWLTAVKSGQTAPRHADNDEHARQ